MTDTASKPAEQAAPESPTITVDGVAVEAQQGELIIEAAERAGVFIPRFCYHPRMKPVGMCRMCLVEVSGPRGFSLQPACFLPVADGLEIRTSSEKARKAQEGVLEFLLINHPLDCPVCDKGGECPLQDQALSHGPGESRFIEEKRHWEKPIEISPLVYLDRERCIQCARCTRFAEEVAGEALIDFAERGDRVEVAIFPKRPFSSYFSGNTVQICPVGALTASPYRFRSRPWDLEQVETTCTTCSVGCRVVAQSSAGKLVRYLGIDAEAVNQSWLCDKGRYAFEAVNAESRFTEPLVRHAGELVPALWHEALRDVAAGVRQARERTGPAGIAVIGGARLTNEDAYAWAKLAKSVLGTDSVDAQVGDGLPAELVLGLPRATIDDAVHAKAVVVLGPDLREELPVLYLRLRAAAVHGSLPIVECSPEGTALGADASARLRYTPGEAVRLAEALAATSAPGEVPGADAASIEAARRLLGGALASDDPKAARGDGVVVVLGRPSLAESAESIAAAAASLHEAWPGARFLSALHRANVHGALDMGLAPGLLPGRVELEEGRRWFADAWGALPEVRGRDTRGILQAAAAGEISLLVLLGADPLADFPDHSLARAALENVDLLVSIATHPDASTDLAHIVLPVSGDAERSGSTTSCEGRVSRLAQKVVPPGIAWAAWMIAVETARRLGADLGFENLETITAEIAELAPAYRGVTDDVLAQPALRDGVVVPVDAVPVAIAVRRDGSSGPRAIDPIATPGILSVEEQGAPIWVGSGVPLGGLGELEVDEPDHHGVPRPSLLTFAAAAAAGAPAPATARRGGDALRLVVHRSLYDRGTVVAASPSLAPLAPDQVLTVNPAELARLGLDGAARVVVRSEHGELEVEVAGDAELPPGLAVLGANLAAANASASVLVDATAAVTDVHLEAR